MSTHSSHQSRTARDLAAPMTKEEAIHILIISGNPLAAQHLMVWHAVNGSNQGWDSHFRASYPKIAHLVFGGEKVSGNVTKYPSQWHRRQAQLAIHRAQARSARQARHLARGLVTLAAMLTDRRRSTDPVYA